jgi:hypothetical protein
VLSSIYILLFYVPYILEKEEREREIEGGVELVFDGTMDGTEQTFNRP